MADPGATAGHAGHDPLRVAEAVDRGARLAAVLDLCARCVSLYGDLVVLTAALPLSALPARSRSFTLTAEDARRLRPGGWRGWWSAVGSARDALTRPLAIGFTTLGIAGLLLTATPTLLHGVGAASNAEVAAPIRIDTAGSTPSGDPAPRTFGGAPMDDAPGTVIYAGPSGTLLLSIGLLAVGGGLFVVRRVAAHGRPMR